MYLGASLVAQLVKNLPAMHETWVLSLDWEVSPGEEKGYPLQPGEFHGLYSPWGCKESDMTEHLSLSHSWRIPMDRAAWWATGVGHH